MGAGLSRDALGNSLRPWGESMMLRPQASQKKSALDKKLVMIFSMGGQSFAAPMEEIGGIIYWPDGLMVPSETPFLNAVVWREKDIMPVFDLAEMLDLTIESDPPLCLLVKHEDGPLAVRIESNVPILQSVDCSSIKPPEGANPIIGGRLELDGRSMAMLYLSKLGKVQA